ncbi:MAG: SDR family oxidoreductase [Bacteroidales bacterium]
MIAVITGATSGIGRAIAFQLAEHGYDLILTGRRKKLLEEMSQTLASGFGIRVLPLCFDIRKKEEAEKYLGHLPDDWQEIDVLINNAGLAAGFHPIHEGDISDWEQMIDTNIKGLLYATRYIAPLMTARRTGHIVNISSIAGKEVYPNGNVYCATKHAVEGLTRGMRIDLLPCGIKVTSVSPGAVETEFSLVRFKGDAQRAKEVYKGYQPLKAEDVAEAVWFALSRPPHVNINDILIMPTAQANAVFFDRK